MIDNYLDTTEEDFDEPELVVLEGENEIDEAQRNYYSQLTQNIPEILIRIFGRGMNPAFYEQKARELAFLFGATSDIDSAGRFFEQTALTDPSIPTVPSNNFAEWDSLRTKFERVDWNYVNVFEVLYKLVKMDTRLAIVLAFAFGLMPQFESENQFLHYFDVTNWYLRNTLAVAIDKFNQDFFISTNEVDGLKMIFIREFLTEILNFEHTKMLRYSDGSLIPYGTAMYELAKLISSGTKINSALLSVNQKRILRYCKRSFLQNGLFPRKEDLFAVIDIFPSTMGTHISRIVEVSQSSNNYVLTVDGRLISLEGDKVLLQLFVELEKDPEIVTHKNLSAEQRLCLSILVREKKEKNVYPSLGLVAKIAKLDKGHVRTIMTSALDILNLTHVYYDKSGLKLSERDIRLQLISKGGLDFAKESDVSENTLKILTMALEMDESGNTFKYNDAEILAANGIDSKNPSQLMYSLIHRVWDTRSEYSSLFDVDGQALTKFHRKAVELLLQFGITDELKSRLSPFYLEIAQALLETDKKGRYYKYDTLCKRFRVVDSVISKVAKLVIAILGQAEL